MKDPIVEEVRRHRREHAQRFNNNLDAICEDLRKHQASCGHPIVRLRPRRITSNKNDDGA